MRPDPAWHLWGVRARLRYRGGRWVYTVKGPVKGLVAEQVVLTDNTGGTPTRIPPALFAQAERDAVVVRRMYTSGHRFHSTWRELVDMA